MKIVQQILLLLAVLLIVVFSYFTFVKPSEIKPCTYCATTSQTKYEIGSLIQYKLNPALYCKAIDQAIRYDCTVTYLFPVDLLIASAALFAGGIIFKKREI